MEIKIKRAYIITTLIILGVIVSINFILYSYKNISENDSVVINLSGRQRMLSQRITFKLLQLHRIAEQNKPIQSEKLEINSLLNNFKKIQLALQKGNEKLKLPQLNNSYIQTLFNQSQPCFNKFCWYTDSLINNTNSSQIESYLNSILYNQQQYLKYQDLITFQFEKEAQRKFQVFSNKMLVLSIISIVLLLLMIPLIFNPILKRLQKANKFLKESSKKYRLFYHNSPAMMHSIDTSGNILNVSNFWLEKMGYTEQEVVGRKSTDFLSEESKKYAKEVILPEYFKTGYCENVPYEFIKKNGDTINVLLSASSEKDNNGNIVKSHAVITDITTEKKAELLQNISYNIAMKLSMEDVTIQDFFEYTQKQLARVMDTSEFYISHISGSETLTFLNTSITNRENKTLVRKQGNGLSEYVIKTKQPLLLNNEDVLNFQKEKGLKIYGKPAKSWLGAPLMSSGKSIGIIACQSHTKENLYDENDLAFLYSIGNQIGLWIDRKKAEEDQAAFARIFEKSLHEVYIFNLESLHFEYANKSSQENLGYTQKELRELTPLDLKEEFTQKEFEEFIAPLKDGEIPVLRFETTHKRKDGTYYPVEIHLQCSVFRGDDVFIATVLDISIRKEAEKEIKEYARFFSLSMEIMCIADTDGYFRKVNPLLLSTLGYTEEELLTNQFYSFIHPDDIEKTNEVVKLLSKGTPTINITNRYRCKDGSYKWLSWAATPDMKTGLLYATGRDVTKLKNAEIALLKSENSLKEAQKITQLGSWEWNVKSDTVKWSDEHYRIFEIPQEDKELTLDRYMTMVHPEDREYVSNTLEDSFNNKSSYTLTHRIITAKNQEKYVEDRGHVELDETGEIIRFYGTCMDVTERIKAEKVKEEFTQQLENEVSERTKELIKSQEQLKEALSKEKELGEMKSRFVSTASHQFRTPMAIIQSNSELLNMVVENADIQLKSKLERATVRIENEIKRMTDLMDDVLILGKITSETINIQKTPTNILELCNELCSQFNDLQQDGRKINFNYEGEIKNANIDSKYISHAIINLISNAFKYSIKDNPKMDLLYNEKDIKIVVTDTGIGIPEDEIKNLFSPFYRAKNVKDIEGTGLGLAITKEYIELNNGNITVESKLNKGTTFTISIPYI